MGSEGEGPGETPELLLCMLCPNLADGILHSIRAPMCPDPALQNARAAATLLKDALVQIASPIVHAASASGARHPRPPL